MLPPAVSRVGHPVLMARRVDKVWKVRTISTVSIVVGMKGDSRRKACNGSPSADRWW